MNEFPENQNNTETDDLPNENKRETFRDEYAEFATVFSEPEQKSGKKIKKGGIKRQMKAVIASAAALALLIGGTVAVIKLVPEKDDSTSSASSLFSDISLVNNQADDLNSVTVTNSNGKYTFLSEKTTSSDSSGTETTVWYIDGIDKSFVSSENIETVIKAAASVTAKRSITEKSEEECGLDAPKYQVDVKSEKDGDYSIYIGSESPDQTGTYVKVSTMDGIYLVYDSGLLSFDFNILDFANTTKLPAASFTTSISSYCDDSGNLTSFDTLTLSGKRFQKPVVLKPNPDSELSKYLGYVIESESGRYANSDRVNPIFKLFSEGMTMVGAYSFDESAESLAKYNLNDPDLTITLSVSGEKKQFKVSVVDDTYCAVVGDNTGYVRKVALEDIPVAKYTVDDIYSSFVYINTISDMANITVELDGEKYSFDISENDEDSDEECTVLCNGTKITASYFQNFYQSLIGVTAADYTTQKVSDQPSLTVSYTRQNGETTTIAYNKLSATKYQYSVNGTPTGRVVSSEYNKIVKYVKRVANNQDIA